MDAAKMTEAEIEATLQELAAEQEAVRERRLDRKIHSRNAAAVLNSVSPEVKHAMVQAATLEAKAEAPKPQPVTTQPTPPPATPPPATPRPAAPQPAAAPVAPKA
jgi:hypothetical protein